VRKTLTDWSFAHSLRPHPLYGPGNGTHNAPADDKKSGNGNQKYLYQAPDKGMFPEAPALHSDVMSIVDQNQHAGGIPIHMQRQAAYIQVIWTYPQELSRGLTLGGAPD